MRCPDGLYRPEFEKENCGFGLIAQMDGRSSHWLVRTAVESLACLTHRGAIAADRKSGDGCGLLLKKPDTFLKSLAHKHSLKLGANYAVGMLFLSRDLELAHKSRGQLAKELIQKDLEVVGWREVPVDDSALGPVAIETLPRIEQVFVNAPSTMSADEFERRLFIARRCTEKIIEPEDDTFYVSSLSGHVISYKGLVVPANLPIFFPDLNDESLESPYVCSTNDFQPTPGRSGAWPSRFASSPITGRSTRSKEIATGHRLEVTGFPHR